MIIKHLILFENGEALVNMGREWGNNHKDNEHLNVTILIDTPGSGDTCVVISCSPELFREYINTKREILDGR